MKIAVVEDDPGCQNGLMDFLKRFEQEAGTGFYISTFNNGIDFLEDYGSGFDIVLMDIDMPLMDGMETARKLREADSGVCLIFVTAMAQYAIKGYEVNAMDFMVKPITYKNFASKLERAVSICTRREKTLLVKLEDGSQRVFAAKDILYLEINNNILTYHVGTKCYTSKNALKNVENALGEDFVRCNNCYLVNLYYVSGIIRNTVLMDNGDELAISRPRKKEFLEALAKYLGRNR